MIYNQLLENLFLPIGDGLNGSRYINTLKDWREIQYYSKERLIKLQSEQLHRLLEFSTKKIPFYRQNSIEIGGDIATCLKQFPILEKRNVREDLEQLLSVDKKQLIPHKTSGSSGIQTTVYMSRVEQSVTRAIQTLWWEWAGFRLGDSLLQTGINPSRGIIKLIKDFLFRTKYVPAFQHSEHSILQILKEMETNPRHAFGGYASSLYLFAKYAKDNNLKARFETAISWGDKMFDHYRNLIREVFDCEVFDTYGVSEGIMIAAQFDNPYYYVMSPHVYLEVVDENENPVKDGELGHILVTRLDSFSMPLIRYRIGDLGIMLPKDEYPTERKLNFPILKKIIGRDTDIVRTRSGKLMVVHFFTGIFEHFPEIHQFQVIQRFLDEIQINYIPRSNFKDEVLDKVSQQIQNHLGEKILIKFQHVNEILPSPSGKPQIVKSELRSNEPDRNKFTQ